MSTVLQDLAFAWRAALQRPAESALIILTLALGIGVNSAMFSAAYQVLLAPLPYADEERLVTLEQRGLMDSASNRWSLPTVADLRRQSSGFEAVLPYRLLTLPMLGQGTPRQILGGAVNWNFFHALGVRPLLGRAFLNSDDQAGAEPVLLLAHDFWQSQFASNPEIVGSTLQLEGIAYRIIGVLPPLPPFPDRNMVWVPAASDPANVLGLSDQNTNRERNLQTQVLGKLRTDTSLGTVNRELAAIAVRLAESYPEVYSSDYGLTAAPLKPALIGSSPRILLLFLGLAWLVLLVACANAANLQLARLALRNSELALREALGAHPGRIARLVLTESLLFALAGGVLSLALALPLLELLSAYAARHTALATEIRLDGSVLLVSIALAALAGMLSGSVSAFLHRDINQVLKEGGSRLSLSRASVRRRGLLLATQCALSFVSLVVSALVLLSLLRLNGQETGYRSDRVLALSLIQNIDFADPTRDFPAQMLRFGRRLLDEVQRLPGVEAAAILTGSPLLNELAFLRDFAFEVEGQPDAGGTASSGGIRMISEDFFRTLELSLLQGRPFLPSDDQEAEPVAIVNATLAERYFPDGDALGRRIKLRVHEEDWRTIVGVVADIRDADLDQPEGMSLYFPFWQWPAEGINLYLRTAGDPGELVGAVVDVLGEIDPNQTVSDLRPLNEVKADWLASTRLRTALIIGFGLLALALTLAGVVGLARCLIGERRREAGIRMALGANPAGIARLFLGQGLRLMLPGLLAGLALMLAGAALIQPFLYETTAVDPAVYLLCAALLIGTVWGALYLPARKAGRLSPMEALRTE